ncbi:hypothetical protein N0V93_007486 [Gnomoniopsis smithogilvyi]|uniref:Uncharacterized protein n=1 Tax=Gnomoniopsis smithogilvyi TaxID=1191159 RepID=A0A9W8YTR8_9PEZI|nr:hypothetical protein N0V93_007486 [Gnomoniopsis smithogilvyi]
MLSGSEIAQHRSADSCWLVIHGKVYDVTTFLDKHPGGRAILLKQAGADATKEFDKIHSEDIVNDLPSGSFLGELDSSTAGALNAPQVADDTSAVTINSKEVLPLAMCVRATDFEAEAKKVLNRRSWIYVISSANSGQSLTDNLDSWSRVTFRPRVLRNVGNFELMHGLVRKGLHAVMSTASSKPLEKIMERYEEEIAKAGGKETNPSRLFFQLYIPTDRQKAITLVRKVKAAGYKGLWITVDTPTLGKRTQDRRKQAEEALEDGRDHSTTATPVGTNNNENEFAPAVGARPVPGQISPMICWDDLEWIREEWTGPIVLKGIQTAEDARLAAEYDCQGILLSNHGGRQQHSAPNGLATLLEIRAYCPEVLEKLEVYLDGGCRDGADILKALALGATAVGIGRPFLYAMAAYGSKGVEKLIDSEYQMREMSGLDE